MRRAERPGFELHSDHTLLSINCIAYGSARVTPSLCLIVVAKTIGSWERAEWGKQYSTIVIKQIFANTKIQIKINKLLLTFNL